MTSRFPISHTTAKTIRRKKYTKKTERLFSPQIDELADVKTAVSEGVTNAIVHGYRNTLGEIFMQIRIFENRHVYIKIRDKGCGIADIEQAMQPLFTTAPEEERAGLGFAVMESFMDKVKVRSRLGEGTTLILEKALKERV